MTTTSEETPVRRGGVRAEERALAPDLARGIMLLLIVLSNTAFHLWAARRGPSGWQPTDGSWLDHAVQFTMIIALDLRVYPLFAFLFGYGMMQLFLRQTAAGNSERGAARILRRRSLWLIVIGLLHSTLLMAGDIVGYYGVLSLVLGLVFLRRSERALKRWICVGAVLMVFFAAQPVVSALLRGELGTLGDAGAEPGFLAYAAQEGNWLTAAGTRLETGLFVTFLASALALVGGGYVVFLLGFWAARRRVLEEPGRHRTLLRRTAVIGVTVGWLGALPAALAHVGALDVPADAQSEEGALTLLRDVTGNAAGLGYVAAVALFVHWWSSRRASAIAGSGASGRAGEGTSAGVDAGAGVEVGVGVTVVTAVSAVGKRSLSCYLAHSLLFAPVLAAWGLGLGEHLSSWTMALFAVGVWLVTVAGAYALERAGRRGPAEAVLRRLMYGAKAKAG
ncbi:DUF418 domain-containing protein [Streptomyces phaeochromogenes]|uniref:DUF418 domain-containing protein n=1 Tax=Streptomyces phaeochromogenes TaxID=1923 RepID=A0ABZ1HAS4_STRPH|nr:DUF418 domain-containing protein [Streptomyces phaeochromogenes]WSD15660.1 DUF418 domain-containing protein [Streptomyces phaeochromogenes]